MFCDIVQYKQEDFTVRNVHGMFEIYNIMNGSITNNLGVRKHVI